MGWGGGGGGGGRGGGGWGGGGGGGGGAGALLVALRRIWKYSAGSCPLGKLRSCRPRMGYLHQQGLWALRRNVLGHNSGVLPYSLTL